MAAINNHEQIFETTAPLSEVLSHFYYFSTPAGAPAVVKHLSPNYEMLMVFSFGTPIRISFAEDALGEAAVTRTAVVGPLRRMLNYEVLPGAEIIVANFTLNGFYRLCKVAMNEIGHNDILDPDILMDNTCFISLWERASALTSVEARIQLLSEYAAAYIADQEAALGPLLNGLAHFNNPAIQPVKAIAAEAQLTERTVQLRFQKYLGYSPKELLRFLRFKAVVHQLLQAKAAKADWYEVIVDNNYHDQSHLIKDFHHFMGITPQQFMQTIKGNDFCISYRGKHY